MTEVSYSNYSHLSSLTNRIILGKGTQCGMSNKCLRGGRIVESDKPENWVTLRRQAQDNWAQSKADMATAVTLRDAGIYYAAVFFSQQAAEKALKAVIIGRLQKQPRGHNLITFANELH